MAGAIGMGLHDPELELVDPTPDIYALFAQFNTTFFSGRLGAVTVEWSKRMTSCAGLCYYQGRAGGCRIKLSEPLLALRPRTDLVDTLIHEMIHAYIFICNGFNRLDRDGHGQDFQDMMHRINAEAGTRVTIYHSFHDEMDHHRKHWWQCDGPCASRGPYFGLVKRSINRPPGRNDTWWASHESTCTGSFKKIREPPPKPMKEAKRRLKKVEGGGSGPSGSGGGSTAFGGMNPITNFFPATKGAEGGASGFTPVPAPSEDEVMTVDISDDEDDDRELRMAIALSVALNEQQGQADLNQSQQGANVVEPVPGYSGSSANSSMFGGFQKPSAQPGDETSISSDSRFPGTGYRLGK